MWNHFIVQKNGLLASTYLLNSLIFLLDSVRDHYPLSAGLLLKIAFTLMLLSNKRVQCWQGMGCLFSASVHSICHRTYQLTGEIGMVPQSSKES